jgi:hypothetical protein
MHVSSLNIETHREMQQKQNGEVVQECGDLYLATFYHNQICNEIGLLAGSSRLEDIGHVAQSGCHYNLKRQASMSHCLKIMG